MRNYGFLDGGIICRPSYVKGLEAAAAKPAQASHSDSAGERQHRRAAAASRHPPTYGGVGVVPSKPSSVMPLRPRRRRPNRLRVRVPLLSPPAKRLRTCGRRERETDIGPIFGSRLAADAKCIIHLPTPLDVVFSLGRSKMGLGVVMATWLETV